jgi:hypothetical protein
MLDDIFGADFDITKDPTEENHGPVGIGFTQAPQCQHFSIKGSRGWLGLEICRNCHKEFFKVKMG